ncbi:MAG: hypothetical protein F6J87_27955 [Spirulina sp. SIO3F2]|nr:hypothetical protein [Spirulina sp. SIO3F2]
MEIEKVFDFSGNLRKLNEIDRNTVDIDSTKIRCLRDGRTFLEVSSELDEKIQIKIFLDKAPIENPTPEKIEQGLTSEPYEGGYVLEGKTNGGATITAKLDPYAKTLSLDEGDVEDYSLKTIRELSIDHQPYLNDEQKVKFTCGVLDFSLLSNLSIPFLDGKYIFSTKFICAASKDSPGRVTSEWTVQKIDLELDDEIDLSTYLVWFELLVSFGSGKQLNTAYKIETFADQDDEKQVEFWYGKKELRQGFGITTIQGPHLASFIQKCAVHVNSENFKDRGLGNALRWYIESFETSLYPVEFMLLCTVLETLVSYGPKISSKIIPKSMLGEIRSLLIQTLDEYGNSLNSDEKRNTYTLEEIEKYNIFRSKVEGSFSDNRLGPLRSKLKTFLESYKTPYTDLFVDLNEFIRIRDNIIHKGFGGHSASTELRRLGNLVVRIFLSMLQYEGDYIESRLAIDDQQTGFKYYGLACKRFPFSNEIEE